MTGQEIEFVFRRSRVYCLEDCDESTTTEYSTENNVPYSRCSVTLFQRVSARVHTCTKHLG